MAFDQDYLAAGGNATSSAADWNTATDLLAYGAGVNIALWRPNSPKQKGIEHLLKGHNDTVTAIQHMQVNGGPSYLISGSADACICLWQPYIGSDNHLDYRLIHHQKAHAASITCLSVLCQIETSFVSGSADSTIAVWKVRIDSVRCELAKIQTMKFGQDSIPLCLASHLLPDDRVVLAAGGTMSDILLFCSSQPDPFVLQATLRGHEGWIRALDFTRDISQPNTSREIDLGMANVLLASASQDKYVRLWRICCLSEKIRTDNAAEVDFSSDVDFAISNKLHQLVFGDVVYLAMFEALLVGHDDWIYTAKWAVRDQKLQLLTSSADNSLTIWSVDKDSGIWIAGDRLGELSIQKGSTSATGSVGGLWNGLWGSDSNTVVGLSRTGSWQKWQRSQGADIWTQKMGVTGHTKAVRAISWACNGAFLLSSSADRTTRLHAEWIRPGASSWHEISRPQIHGYDLNCLGAIGSTSFVSGADEKLLRVFDEPDDIAADLYNLCRAPAPKSREVKTACVPVLGLSNKAEDKPQDLDRARRISEDLAESVSRDQCQIPPHEDYLAKSSLWPETEKLYGHGFEIQCVAVSRDQTLIATSCKASSLEHAVIRLFSTHDWRQAEKPLRAHSLTVTGLDFNADSSLLLSVGRDRQWVVWAKDHSKGASFNMSAAELRAHSRMILSACWLLSGTLSMTFATGGRERTIKIWTDVDGEYICRSSLQMDTAPVVLESSPMGSGEDCLIACGLENGGFCLLKYAHVREALTMFWAMPSRLCPSGPITSLAWRPSLTWHSETLQSGTEQVAVASEDGSVRIFSCCKSFLA